MGASQSAGKSDRSKRHHLNKTKKRSESVPSSNSDRRDQHESLHMNPTDREVQDESLPDPTDRQDRDQNENPTDREDQFTKLEDESLPNPTGDRLDQSDADSLPNPTDREDQDEPPPSPRRIYECNRITLPLTECRAIPFFKYKHGNVVAIDFGTTFCSMFHTLNESEIAAVLLDGREKRIPTAILVNDRGEILAFGDQAGCQYENKKGAELNRHYYFHHIKMLLERDRKISRNSLVKADNGQEFFLIEVIAMMLKHMKDRLLNYQLSGTVEQVDPNNFTWVLTVPAIWEAEGKQMMREAAYFAGIASTGIEIERLTHPKEVSFKRSKPDEAKVFSEKLILALEPEAAALYCLEDAKKAGDPSANASSYVVIDAGGGTLDITAHRLTKEADSHQIEVIMPPCGNNAGGNMVNDEFMTYLENHVKDKEFSSMLENKTRVEYAKNYSAITKIRECFERKKVLFGDGHINDSTVSIVLESHMFMRAYEKILNENIAKNQSGEDQSIEQLTFDYETFEHFFKKTLDKAMNLVKDSVTENDLHTEIDAVFCVGGFGGCSLFYNEIKKLLASINPSIRVYRPQFHSLAVGFGAISFGKTPDIIKSRKAGATYGTRTCTQFIESQHRLEHEFYDDDDKRMCNHLFSPYVLIGDKVHIDQCLFDTFNPVAHNQKAVTFDLYRTIETVGIPYTHRLVGPLTSTNKQFEIVEGLRQVGSLTLTLPEDERNLDKDRKIRLTFDFAHTEIHVEAYDCDYDKKVSSTIDFLTMTR